MDTYLNILELTALVISLLSLRIKTPIFNWISFILLLTVLNEVILLTLVEKRWGAINNMVFYNVFSLIDMTVWFIIFYHINRQKVYRKATVIAYSFCLLYSMVELLFLKGWHQLHTDSFRVYSICIILSAIFYFYEKVKEPYHDFITDPLFWIATACFLYHSLNFVTFTLHQQEYWKVPRSGYIALIVQNTGNTFYYLLISLSFLLCYFSSSRRIPT